MQAWQAHRQRSRTYASPAILARRSRVLASARAVLADRGVRGTSMFEVGRRANISKRHLYYMFESRETLIGAAVQENFARDIAGHAFAAPAGSLERIVERIERSLGEEESRLCMQVIAELYAGPDSVVPAEIGAFLRGQYADWLRQLRGRRQLRPWIDMDTMADDLVRYELATINDWSNGRFKGRQPVERLLSGLLSFALGLTEDAARAEIEHLMRAPILSVVDPS